MAKNIKTEKVYFTKKVSGKSNVVLGEKVSSNNLTSKQLITWKNDVDTAISKNLTNSLKRTYEDIVKLKKITASSQDSNFLNQRLKKLANATEQITKKLTSSMKSFDTNITTFIKTIESSEKDISAKVKSSVNKISAATARISKIK